MIALTDVLAAGAVVVRTDVAGVSGISRAFVYVGVAVVAGVFITTDIFGIGVTRKFVV